MRLLGRWALGDMPRGQEPLVLMNILSGLLRSRGRRAMAGRAFRRMAPQLRGTLACGFLADALEGPRLKALRESETSFTCLTAAF